MISACMNKAEVLAYSLYNRALQRIVSICSREKNAGLMPRTSCSITEIFQLEFKILRGDFKVFRDLFNVFHGLQFVDANGNSVDNDLMQYVEQKIVPPVHLSSCKHKKLSKPMQHMISTFSNV